jgi:uncharacterized protein
MNIYILTNKDCNLRCKYCYEIAKEYKVNNMFNICSFIDLFDSKLGYDYENKNDILVDVNFMGGDSLSQVDLVKDTIDYFNYKRNTSTKYLNGKNIKYNIATNGTYFNPEVKDLILTYKDILGINVSLDGHPELHDINRINPDGSGSFLQVEKFIDFLIKENIFNFMNKITLSKASIPYLYDTIRFMHEKMKIPHLKMNFVMDYMGDITDSDLEILDNQMLKVSEYYLNHVEYDNTLLSYYNTYIYDTDITNKLNYKCGAGNCFTLDCEGDIYSCFRFAPPSVTNNKLKLSNVSYFDDSSYKDTLKFIRDGIVPIKMSDEECNSCDIALSCPYCPAGCYSEFGEFKRTKYICKIHKQLVKNIKPFWKKFVDKYPNSIFSKDIKDRITDGWVIKD